MTVYIDIVLFLNFFFDLLLLMTVSIILKRRAKLRSLVLGGLVGAMTILSLFIPMNSILLFIVKIILGAIMVIVTFGFKSWKFTVQNIIYLYMISTLLGGGLYYFNMEFGYQKEGLLFFKAEEINYFFFLLLTPIILYLFVKCQQKLKTQYEFYYEIKVHFKNNREIALNAFLDTGNKLVDPITNKGIILVEKRVLDGIVNIRSPIYVPYHSLNHNGLLKCISPKWIEVNGNKSQRYLIGLSEEKFKIDGIDCILNAKCLEEI